MPSHEAGHEKAKTNGNSCSPRDAKEEVMIHEAISSEKEKKARR